MLSSIAERLRSRALLLFTGRSSRTWSLRTALAAPALGLSRSDRPTAAVRALVCLALVSCGERVTVLLSLLAPQSTRRDPRPPVIVGAACCSLWALMFGLERRRPLRTPRAPSTQPSALLSLRVRQLWLLPLMKPPVAEDWVRLMLSDYLDS